MKNGYPSNQDWIDHFRQRQAAIRVTRLQALEKITAEAWLQQPTPPASLYWHWVNTVGHWLVAHSWIAQQLQKRRRKTAEAPQVVSTMVIGAEYNVIEIGEE
jgi:hypothetical protein